MTNRHIARRTLLTRTGFGVGAGEILSSVQIAMIAGLPYTASRDAMQTHPTLVEGLIPLFSSVPAVKPTLIKKVAAASFTTS